VADPISISVPATLQCYQFALAANGPYDTSLVNTLPPDVDRATVTWQVKGHLSVPQLPAAPTTCDATPFQITVLPRGQWNLNFPLGEGTNATLVVELWASVDTTNPKATSQVTTFDVLASCPTAGGGIDTDARLAKAARALAAPPKPQYQWFSGTYDPTFNPKIVRIECVIQRRQGNKQRVLSRAEAELKAGRWAVVINVPDEDPHAEDYLMATFYTLGGIAVLWREKKVQ
jgi:hypothetical protein